MSLDLQSRRPRRGFVLAFTVLLLLAMTLLAHGLLVLTRTHRRAAEQAWTARASAWTVVGVAVDEARSMDRLPSEDRTHTLTFAGGSVDVLARVLSPEVALVEAWVDSIGSVGAGGLVWALDPALRIASLPRAVETGWWPAIETLARVTTEPEPETCAVDAVAGGTSRPAVALRASDDTLAVGMPPGLGRLSGQEIASRLAVLPGSAGTPTPVVAGEACLVDPWNWGDPSTASSPCADRWVGAWWPGDLTLTGGAGQGVVAVAGDLVLSGTRLAGLLLVGGDLILGDGADVEGVARVGGALSVDGASRFGGAPCLAYRSLAAVAEGTELGAALVLPRPGWILH